MTDPRTLDSHDAPLEAHHAGRTALVREILIALAVALIVAAAYWPALSTRAVMFDDEQYLDDNPLVQTPSLRSAGLFLSEILHPSTVGGYYQPLSMISLMLDYALGGRPEDPTVFRATSLTLHALNAALVVLLFFTLFKQVLPAALAGLAFGLHPMNVEPVVWMAERKTLLASFFAILAILCYLRYAINRNETPRDREPRVLAYSGSLLFFALALLSKPTITMLPLCLLLLDLWPLRIFSRRALIEKLPFFALAAVSAYITVLSQRNTAEITRPLEYPPSALPLIICHNVVFYLRKVLLPWPLSGYYAFPKDFSIIEPAYLLGVLGTAGLLGFCWFFRARLKPLLFGLTFFFIAIAPAMGIIGFTVVIAADRFVYFPIIGLLLPVAWFLSSSSQSIFRGPGAALQSPQPARRGGAFAVGSPSCNATPAAWPRRLTLTITIIALAAYAFAARTYIARWSDSVSFTKYMLAGAPDATSLHLSLGRAFEKQSRLPEAAAEYQLAVQYEPRFHSARVSLAQTLLALENVDEAAAQLQEALRLKPSASEAHLFLAQCLARQHKLEDARAHYQEAIRFRPGDHKPYYNYATFLASIGKREEAVEQYKLALHIKPDHAATLYNLGLTYFQMGRVEDALARLSDCLSARRDHTRARYQLACANMVQGKFGVALDFWRAALKIEPNYVEAMCDLAWVLAVSDDSQYRSGSEALQWANRAHELAGDVPEILDVLAAAKAETGDFDGAAATQRSAIALVEKLARPIQPIGPRVNSPADRAARLKSYESAKPWREKIRELTYQPKL